jgi:hypothetical protein
MTLIRCQFYQFHTFDFVLLNTSPIQKIFPQFELCVRVILIRRKSAVFCSPDLIDRCHQVAVSQLPAHLALIRGQFHQSRTSDLVLLNASPIQKTLAECTLSVHVTLIRCQLQITETERGVPGKLFLMDYNYSIHILARRVALVCREFQVSLSFDLVLNVIMIKKNHRICIIRIQVTGVRLPPKSVHPRGIVNGVPWVGRLVNAGR